MRQERVGHNVLRVAGNVTSDLAKWKQLEEWTSQRIRETIYRLRTSAQETVLTLSLTILIRGIKRPAANRSLIPLLEPKKQGSVSKRRIRWRVLRRRGISVVWFAPHLPLIGFRMLFLQDLIRNILPGALAMWRFFLLLLSKFFFSFTRKKLNSKFSFNMLEF